MKRFGLALLGLLVLGWTAGAQTSREELLSHMELTGEIPANLHWAASTSTRNCG